jgi:hypothetical protein
MHQKGYMIFTPASRKILISDDVIFDESFFAAIATTWQQHKDSLALQPAISYIPDATMCQDHTGTVEYLPTITLSHVEEGSDAPRCSRGSR